jgi:hypothetical protein
MICKNILLYARSVVSGSLRALVFSFMEHFGVSHGFNRTEKTALWQWIYLFSKRHPRLSACNEENLSINRALGMNETSNWAILQNYRNKNC